MASSSIVPPPLPNLYQDAQIALLNRHPIPHHVAIIMDGNRRWAQKKSVPSLGGHWAGAQTLTTVVNAAAEIGIKVLTVYAFSTENWARPQEEVNGLLELLEVFLKEQQAAMLEGGVRLQTIGNISCFPQRLQDAIQTTKDMTSSGEKIELVLALNYGGRDDIKRALQEIVEDYSNHLLSKSDLTELLISQYLDTAKWQDPDLLIRTSGELRLSNFLLWQISYAEIYVTETLWPDFTHLDLYDAILEFQHRQRRIGA